MPTILLNKAHFPVTTLGYGRRVGLWLQGCSIHCPGCVNKDTWEFHASAAVELDSLLTGIAPWLAEADGVTISGGEPFDQPEALTALLTRLRAATKGDLLVFSGYSHEHLQQPAFAAALAVVDVLISDPYRADAGQSKMLRGSDNQRIFLQTDLARARYPAGIDSAPWSTSRRLDLVLEGDAVWMAGIPRPEDLTRLRDLLAARGYEMLGSDQAAAIRA